MNEFTLTRIEISNLLVISPEIMMGGILFIIICFSGETAG